LLSVDRPLEKRRAGFVGRGQRLVPVDVVSWFSVNWNLGRLALASGEGILPGQSRHRAARVYRFVLIPKV
jgi:hypothetical protein